MNRPESPILETLGEALSGLGGSHLCDNSENLSQYDPPVERDIKPQLWH